VQQPFDNIAFVLALAETFPGKEGIPIVTMEQLAFVSFKVGRHIA
jgi:hypothetical protein